MPSSVCVGQRLAGAPVLHWHGDAFELSAGTDLPVFSAMTPHQAFRAGRGQLALQFHPEAAATRMETWLIGHCCELAQAGPDPRHVRANARR